MKVLLLLVAAWMGIGSPVTAQVKKDSSARAEVPPYLKYPTLPAFNVLLSDSSTLFNTYNIPKGKPAVLMLFDPGCSHCQKFAKELTEKMDSLKNLRFYLVTSNQDMPAIRKFAEDYQLAKYPNIEVIGRDYEFFFISYYKVQSVPDLAIYDKNKKLVKLIDTKVTVDELLKHTRNLK